MQVFEEPSINLAAKKSLQNPFKSGWGILMPLIGSPISNDDGIVVSDVYAINPS